MAVHAGRFRDMAENPASQSFEYSHVCQCFPFIYHCVALHHTRVEGERIDLKQNLTLLIHRDHPALSLLVP